MLNRIKGAIKPKYIPIVKLEKKEDLLKNKVVLITGGDGGIGFSIASELIENGAKVIITARNEQKLDKCCKLLGTNCKYVVLDQLHVSEFENKITEIDKLFGKVDILINSSGTHISRKDMNLFNITEKEYDDVVNLNLKGTYFFTQMISKYMIKKKIKGHILFISSSRGAEPVWSPYQISKQAIIKMTEGFAQQLAPYGIIVVGIAPGPTATSLIDFKEGDSIYTDDTAIKRYTMPSEIASFVRILISEMGDTMVGQTIYMSGGRGVFDKR